MPWDDDAAALAEEDALREAGEEEDAEPDTPGAPRPPDVDAVGEEVSAAGDGVGVGVCPVKAGSQFVFGWRAPTSASRPAAVGRCRGSLARQRSISGRASGGTWSRLGKPWTTRYSSAAVVPVPNGPWPVAAKARTAPRLKMSLGGPTS